jgi:two-component system phosphate regulon sensor histidine kinase PhoR
MTKKIFQSICIAAVTVFFISLILIMGVLYNYFTGVQMRQLHIQADLAARAVESGGLAYLESLADDDCRITWIDPQGSVLFDNRTSRLGMENHLEREEIVDALKLGKGESKRYSTTLLERQLYCAVRLADGSVLRLSSSQPAWWSLALGMVRPILLVALAAVGISLFLAFRLSKWIIRPLNTLNLDELESAAAYEEVTPLLERIGSQQEKIRRQEAEAEQMRREFTANVSHELKTPLQSISGYAELLSEGMVKREDVPHFSKQILAESRRMIALVEDIIRLSHLDEGADDMQREDVDLYELAALTIRNLTPAAESAGISLHLSGERAMLYGIPFLLETILFNLCDNAIKYNRKGGSASIRIETAPEAVLVSVSDTGIGIPKPEQERIFERFYRVDKSRSKAVGGTGLGLSIVKHAAIVHDARIEIDSTVGKGTTFTVIFPCK